MASIIRRYLFYFSYIGTKFRGVQRQKPRNEDDPTTVQGLIDMVIDKMKPVNAKPCSLLASRTDGGVHALKSALTIDLQFNYFQKPEYIQQFLNKYFYKTGLPIRIHDAIWVPWNFDVRKMPVWRKYIYRFAVLKKEYANCDFHKYNAPISITEMDRCHVEYNTDFDFEQAQKVCNAYVGFHDFISFLGKPNSDIHQEYLTTTRCVHEAFLERASPYLPSEYNQYFDYYHFHVVGRSFIYNQIRKMLTVLISVAQGKKTIDDVHNMLKEPIPYLWKDDFDTVGPNGLYLTDIYYDPKDLKLPDDIKEEFKNSKPLTADELKYISDQEQKVLKKLKKYWKQLENIG